MPKLKDIKKNAASLMGLTQHAVGKTQARREFFPLVDALGSSATVVEITDHDKPVAILLSYHHYMALIAKLSMLTKTPMPESSQNLIGSIKIKSSNLEAASAKVAAKFKKSFKQTASSL